MEAVLETEILGRPAKLEFNFEKDKLYSYYFFTTNEDEDAAVQLYEYLQDFYKKRFGSFLQEEQQEGEIYAVTSYWQTGAFHLSFRVDLPKELGWKVFCELGMVHFLG